MRTMQMKTTRLHPAISVVAMGNSNHRQICTSEGYVSVVFLLPPMFTTSQRWITATVALRYLKRPPYQWVSVLRILGQAFLYPAIACQTCGIPPNAVG